MGCLSSSHCLSWVGEILGAGWRAGSTPFSVDPYSQPRVGGNPKTEPQSLYFFLMRIVFDMVDIFNQLVLRWPSHQEFLWFENIKIFGYLGLPYFNLTAIGIVADCWICFGWLGIIIGPLTLGTVFYYADTQINRAPAPFATILKAITVLAAIWTLYSNYVSTMITATFFVIIVSSILLRLAHRPRRINSVSLAQCVRD